MERRVIFAIVLMLFVAVLPSILFPTKATDRRKVGKTEGDTTAAVHAPPVAATPEQPSVRPAVRPTVAAETVWATSPHYRLGFSTRGGTLVRAELLDFKSFTPGDSGRPVQLVPDQRAPLVLRLVVGGDTVPLADWTFTPTAPALRVDRDGAQLSFAAEREGGSGCGACAAAEVEGELAGGDELDPEVA